MPLPALYRHSLSTMPFRFAPLASQPPEVRPVPALPHHALVNDALRSYRHIQSRT
jgi:hypothetical protein